MDTATAPTPITVVDVTQVRSKEMPSDSYNSAETYLVVARDVPDDIFRILNISTKDFNIFADATKPHHAYGRNFWDRSVPQVEDRKFAFRAGMEIFIYIAKKQKDQQHHHYNDDPDRCVHLSIPNALCKASKITFRQAKFHNDEHTATLTISVGDSRSLVHVSAKPEVAEAAFGLSFVEDGVTCMGTKLKVTVPNCFYQRYAGEPVSFTLKEYVHLKEVMNQEANVLALMRLLKQREGMTGVDLLVPAGNKKVLDQVLPFYKELLKEDEPILLAAFQTIAFECKRTINGVKVAKFFNEFFASVRDLEGFKAKLREIYAVLEEAAKEWYSYSFDELFAKFPGYNELRKQALRSQSGRALNKMVTDIDAINFDQAKYPVLAELINDGSIPVSTFFRKQGEESYFLFNDNWDLFEKFLGKHREVGIELAKLASQRTTYEKGLMSYMYFVLHELPEYLEKHTGKRWTCFPKIVESANELEPGPTKPGETTKKRSALTPIVDNEACTVTVPYACLKIHGVQTTYTYSLNYSIVQRGLSIEGAVATKDVEEKLNGRDDYGLMFYTLTGTIVGRGYPTFLIIFERLDEGQTRVHFHRTHPLRSKDGDKNPVNNWIRTCYNWMVGNVNLTSIKAQQGDLVFVSMESLPEGERAEVNSYDSHTFERPVSFIPCTKKDSQNILGYFEIAADATLNHPEHRARLIPAGKYELRQCRSWEANPKGIWTLRID